MGHMIPVRQAQPQKGLMACLCTKHICTLESVYPVEIAMDGSPVPLLLIEGTTRCSFVCRWLPQYKRQARKACPLSNEQTPPFILPKRFPAPSQELIIVLL